MKGKADDFIDLDPHTINEDPHHCKYGWTGFQIGRIIVDIRKQPKIGLEKVQIIFKWKRGK